MRGLLLMGLVVQLIALAAEARKVDIEREIRQIVRHHNGEKRDGSLLAPYMMQYSWNQALADRAQQFAEKCEYRRPSIQESNSAGSNLYYQPQYTEERHGIHRMVQNAMRAWTRGKETYRTDEPCGRNCDYAQMVYYRSDEIGCALNTCPNMRSGRRDGGAATLFVCLYTPRYDAQSYGSYTTRPSCQNCPRNTACHKGLCHNRNEPSVPIYVPKPYVPEPYVPRPAPTAALSRFTSPDELSREEVQELVSDTNIVRERNGLGPVRFDPYLDRWARWVINCDVDYPGPRNAYTNFARLDPRKSGLDQTVSRLVDQWNSEGNDVNIRFQHGCRTPYDRERCNHNTVMQALDVESMACAGKVCDDSTRQIVCIYDSRDTRPDRRKSYGISRPSEVASLSRPRPRPQPRPVRPQRRPARPVPRPIRPRPETRIPRPQPVRRPVTRRPRIQPIRIRTYPNREPRREPRRYINARRRPYIRRNPRPDTRRRPDRRSNEIEA